jgi:RNA polymerase primary sigma factor
MQQKENDKRTMRQLKIAKSITKRDSASIDRYLAEISKTEMITAEEEADLARKIRAGDRAALLKLTTANLRFVVSVAKQYQNQGLSLPDLINEGNIGLMKAASRFDETRGFKFISYAVWWIRQCIITAVAEQCRMIRLPLNKIGVLNKIKKAQSRLEQELERAPSLEELSAVLDISPKEIDAAISASPWHLSTDHMIEGESYRFGDMLPDVNAENPDDLLMDESRSADIQRALNSLTLQERDIITKFFGIGFRSPLSLDEIALKYDLSRERVRQIKEKALKKLRHPSRNKQLGVHSM